MTLKIDSARLRELQAAAPHAKFDRLAQLAEGLYGGGPHGRVVSSFHDRFEAAHREDREALTKSREARSQHEAFFKRVEMDPKDAALGLGRLLEYESLPRTPEVQQKIAERTFESLRMELGSTEEAQAAVAAHNRFMSEYAKTVPYFAERARLHGANVDADIVRLGARYGAKLK